MTIEDIALTMTSGLGVKGVVHLLEIFGDARSIFSATHEELVGRGGLKPEAARTILARNSFKEAEREVEYCRRNGIEVIASTDAGYPPLLREVPDYPHVLYIRGNADAMLKRCISIVGTREATPYGQLVCNRMVEGLAERLPGLCIVSGLAFGIDIAAHRAALAAGVATVAVLPCTLPNVVPAQHAPVARDILDNNGALITELSSQAKQTGSFYLARNRIIAAMSAGTIVVESDAHGGSLSTANHADGYNRTVMAVPGRITDRSSLGTNNLIRNRKAQLVVTPADVIEELQWELGVRQGELWPATQTPQLTPDEAGLLACFRTSDPVAVDELRSVCGLDAGALAALLVGLELSGMIRQLPGNRYMKLV